MAKVAKQEVKKQVAAKAPESKAPKSKTITVLVKNPKRDGSQSHKRFALYRDGMSEAEYATKVGSASLARADIRWDQQRQFISLK